MTYYKVLIKSKDNILTSLYNDFIYEIEKEYTHLGEIIIDKKRISFLQRSKRLILKMVFHYIIVIRLTQKLV